MKLKVDKRFMEVADGVVIPYQSLENKVAYGGIIADVFPSSYDGKEVDFVDATAISVRIKSPSGSSSLMALEHLDFNRLMAAYAAKTPGYLVGKPVVSVYSENWGQMLCGFIPPNIF